jgi:GNAT superfamily N-acetyltransferase
MTLNLDGYTDLPAGKLASVVTYLEMTSPPPLQEIDTRELSLRHLDRSDLDEYRRLFREIGQNWLWGSRLLMSDGELSRILRDPPVDLYELLSDGFAKGLLELDRREFPDIEISFFGVTEDMIGRGAGKFLMSRALEIAWRHRPKRVWLHTCSLDHPRALAFYIKAGFRPYRRALEVWADPRLSGALPREAAPHVPLL